MVFLFCVIAAFMTSGVNSECMVNDIPTQENFDFEKFMGLWYEASWYSSDKPDPSNWMSDKIHYAVQTDEKNATFYKRGRIPGESTCQHGVNQLTQPGNDAKLQITSTGITTPFWIIDTDYDDYALVYSCYEVSNSGSCSKARAMVWSRDKSLSQSALDITGTFYQNICVQESEFESVAFESTCDIKTHVNLDPDNQCLVKDLKPQSNFDITRFAGKWYEIKYLVNQPWTQKSAYWDIVHHFNYDDLMNVTDNVYFRTTETMESCLNFVLNWRKTSSPGAYLENDDNHMVMETDYSQYALLYKCMELETDGRCKQGGSRILSRTTDLPAALMHHLHRTLQGMCVNPSVFLTTNHKNACEYKTHIEPSSPNKCLVKDLKPQSDFDINKFTGKWYEVKYIVNQAWTQRDAYWDIMHYINFRNRDMDIADNIYFRIRGTDACTNINIEWTKTSTPGVFKESDFEMFVVATDYSQYALLYKCMELETDGRCKQAGSRILSRTTDLPAELKEQLFGILQDMCVKPSVFLTPNHKNECKFETHVKPSSESQCLVRDLQPQNNFDITKFAGKWYEIKYLVNQPWTQRDAYWDIVHHFESNSDMDVTDNVHFRTRETDACMEIVIEWTKTPTPGTYLESNSKMHVVATDYSQYALLYKCMELETDGRCKQAGSRILSRTTDLPAELEERLFGILKDMCVKPYVFLKANHKNDCSPSDMDPSSAPTPEKSCLQMLLLLLLVFLLKQ